jgi:uncharacterized protein YfaT (DUF1175 family)
LPALGAGCHRSNEARTSRPPIAAAPLEDADSDGFPGAAELRTYDDRANFRRWFAAIAERQFYEASGQWNEAQRDCAGLVRFAWREALRRHDRAWFQAIGFRSGDGEGEPVAPDVDAYRLETGPLGEKLFRTHYGAFHPDDLAAGRFSEFADARTLKNHNASLIGRDLAARARIEPGDLLFFHQPWVQRYPYHVMIYLGRPRQEMDGTRDWVVYHTGAAADDEGMVRKMRLAELDRHPERRWRPLADNRHFLGYYRLKILE